MTLRQIENKIFRKDHSGFSLVEVALALGVAAFALIALLSLVPAGIKSTKVAVEEDSALNLLGVIAADRMSTPAGSLSEVYGLPALVPLPATSATGSFGAGDDYRKTSSLQTARFRIDYRITPPPSGQQGPLVGNFRASWPASAQTPENSVEIVTTFPQP